MMCVNDYDTLVERKTDEELRADYFTFQALLAAIEPEWLDTLTFQAANEVSIAVNDEICRRFCGISERKGGAGDETQK